MRQPDSLPIELEVFKHLFASVAEEMGVRLMRSAYSPNIKERRDYSCALFDRLGQMVAQAAHIPVHLGSAPMSVMAVIEAFGLETMHAGVRYVVNDPFAGGTHLPDITVVKPVFVDGQSGIQFFVANRAHHADIGGITPGSMPLSTSIQEEGLRIPPTILTDDVVHWIAENSRTPSERRGDLLAQVAALDVGAQRVTDLCGSYGSGHVLQMAAELQDYTESVMRTFLRDMDDGEAVFTDYLDDDGMGLHDIPIVCSFQKVGDRAVLDFRESADQVTGPLNAVRAVTLSAVNYVFRCLAPADAPSNSGIMRPLTVLTRSGSILEAQPPAAVAGGNVETSQRTVDAVLGAVAQLLPDRIPAASGGTMNNLTVGGEDPRSGRTFTYYETIAGGAGAGPSGDGASAVHTHMTNTLNTPVEALEHAYPFRIQRYAIREGSGGSGRFRGGDGVIRTYVFESDADVSLLTERRRRGPYGLNGGVDGRPGRNLLRRSGGDQQEPPGKGQIKVQAGDELVIESPGGGGWGARS